MSAALPLLQDLADCRDKGLVGGKAINLGQLIRAGFPVPGGFVVTTEAYRLAHNSAACAGAGGQGPDLRALSGLAEQIRGAWRRMGSVPVAVRSSATAEDMAEASMAGQYDTFLDIGDEEALLNAIQCCWASLDSPRTRTYLAEHGIDLAKVAMAVVVQKLVPAEVAGVMFTANPRTGSRHEMVIEASWGLGEAVVSGRVQPDVLVLERQTGRVTRAVIADKQVQIPPGHHEEKAVEEERRRVACLRSGDAAQLWQLGRRGVEYFGAPQDMEWAIYDGQVYLLQSRPITTLQQAEAYEQLLGTTRAQLRGLLEQNRGPWVLHNISETLKHPTALTWSVIRRFMAGSGGFGAMYREAGFEPGPRVCAEGFLQNIAGKVYMDLSLAPEMFFEGYPFKYDLGSLRSNPDAGQAPPTVPAGSYASRVKMARRCAAAGGRVHQLAEKLDRRLNEAIIPEFVAWVRQEKERELEKLSTEALIDLWQQRSKRVMDEFAPQSLLPSMVSAMAIAELRAFVEEHFWDEDPDGLATILSAPFEPDKTVLANAQLYEVATGKRTVEKWLADHGHRAPDEFDLATPRWRERPEELVAMASRLKGGSNPLDLHHQHAQQVRRKLDELNARLSGGGQKELERHIGLVHRYMPFREDGKYYLMLGYELLREVALEAGRRLEIGSEVFHLSLEELLDALRVGFAPLHLIAQRKIVYEAEGRISLPMVIDGGAIETLGEPPKLSTAGSHKAFAVSMGVARGPARIVRRPEEAGELGTGYILVCPSTDPGWTPLFVNAAGLVLECGGTLSHGAVIAREMSIPAVVLPGATGIFQDGQTIVVDGRNGVVGRGEEEEARRNGGMGEWGNGREDEGARGEDVEERRIERGLVPPVAGEGERRAGRIRNVALLVWGVYLMAAFGLPEGWVYGLSMGVLDAIFWPVLGAIGRPMTVALIAGGMAALTMVGQRLLTDNTRLREAKRRAGELMKRAGRLPKGCARAVAMQQLAAPVQMRVVGASLVPLAVLLGPMVMTFAWLPSRVDPASWNAPPGTPVSVVATIDSNWRKPVSLLVERPLEHAEPEKVAKSIPPIRQTLEKLAATWQRAGSAAAGPPELQAALQVREEMLTEYLRADLKAYLDRGVPPQTLTWRLRPEESAAGRFPVILKTEGAPELALNVILGDQYPPGPMEVVSDGAGPLVSMKVVYQPAQQLRQQFWAPLAFVGKGHWDAGWLVLYLLVYLPVMFALRWVLGVV